MNFAISIDETKPLGVNLRELHGALMSCRDFTNWAKAKLSQFIDGQDFEVYANSGVNPQGGRPSKEWNVSVECAKHIAMMEQTERGRMVRQYFIECERVVMGDARAVQAAIADHSEALRLAADEMQKRKALEVELKKAEPAVKFHEVVTQNEESEYEMSAVAKVLAEQLGRKVGRNNLFKVLRGDGVLMSSQNHRNEPYQQYVSRGYFRQVIVPWENPKTGLKETTTKTVVTGKGVEWLIEKFQKVSGAGGQGSGRDRKQVGSAVAA